MNSKNTPSSILKEGFKLIFQTGPQPLRLKLKTFLILLYIFLREQTKRLLNFLSQPVERLRWRRLLRQLSKETAPETVGGISTTSRQLNPLHAPGNQLIEQQRNSTESDQGTTLTSEMSIGEWIVRNRERNRLNGPLKERQG
jgi:hypothetical protein